MASKIVGDHHVAGCEGRGEALLDPGCEHLAVDRAIQHEGCNDAVVTQPGQEGQGFPVPVRDVGS